MILLALVKASAVTCDVFSVGDQDN